VNWWSGSDASGNVVADTCSGFTSTATLGQIGFSSPIDTTWISFFNVACTFTWRILCIAF
jgi:hypothetical protein